MRRVWGLNTWDECRWLHVQLQRSRGGCPSENARAGNTGPVPAGEPLFSFESVSVGPPGARRLDALDARLPADGLTVVAGPSGSGKSTLLRLCNRLEVPSEGTVRHCGADITQRDVLALRREVAMVFQRPV